MDLCESVAVDGMQAAGSACVAEERTPYFGPRIGVGGEKLRKHLVSDVEGCELSAWKQFKVFWPSKTGVHGKFAVDTRWVLTWTVVDGGRTAKA